MWYLQVNLGNGDGTFGPPSFTQLFDGNAGQPAVGDFNGDGKLDVAIPSPAGVSVFWGNGDGTFRGEADFSTPCPQSRLVLADLNGDGHLDIVTNGVSVLLGDGHGNFTPGGAPTLGGEQGNVLLGDWDGNGKLDLAVVTAEGNQEYLVLALGNGDGTFTGEDIVSGNAGNTRLFDIGFADFNGDGRLDFVISGDKAVAVMLQKTGP